MGSKKLTIAERIKKYGKEAYEAWRKRQAKKGNDPKSTRGLASADVLKKLDN